jgi:hypothetical protein
MQNKWFVGGMALPAVALAGVTFRCLTGDNWLLAIVPAVLAAGLFRGAWWAWHCEPFASVDRQHTGDMGTSVAVARWNQHRAERDAAAAKAAITAGPAAGPPKS